MACDGVTLALTVLANKQIAQSGWSQGSERGQYHRCGQIKRLRQSLKENTHKTLARGEQRLRRQRQQQQLLHRADDRENKTN